MTIGTKNIHIFNNRIRLSILITIIYILILSICTTMGISMI
jgi:hypothetical protein